MPRWFRFICLTPVLGCVFFFAYLTVLAAQEDSPASPAIPPPVTGDSSPAAPILVVEPASIDFGATQPVTHIEKVVPIRNTGASRVDLTDFKWSCPCMNASLSATFIEPGATASLTVTMDLSDYHKNEVRGQVSIRTSLSSQPLIEIPVTADIIPEYTLEPKVIDFGTVHAGVAHTQAITVRPAGYAPLSVTHVTAPQHISARIQPLTDAPGYAINVSLLETAPVGPFQGKLVIETDVARMPEAEVPFMGTIGGFIAEVNPRALVFGPSSPGAVAGELRLHLSFPATIEKIQTSLQGLECIPATKEKQTEHTIAVRLTPDATPGDRIGRITITLADSSFKEDAEITVFGSVAAKE